MADGCVPIAVSPVPFHSREQRAMAVGDGTTVRAVLAQAARDGILPANDLARTLPRTRVMVNGEVLARDTAMDTRLSKGDVVNIEVSEMGGRGGKDVGQILLTIAVIVVSAWVGGPSGPLAALPALLRTVAAAAIMAAGQAGIAALFAPEEQKSRTNERYALQSASNQYRPWAPFPIALGEVIAAPDFAVKTYTQNQGEDVWIYGILGLHLGPCEISEIKIGDTLVSSMGAGDWRSVEHLTPGPRDFALYPYDTDQLDLSEELEATTSSGTPVIRAGSAEGERFDFDFFLPGGLHFQKDDGRVLAASVTVSIAYRPIDEDGVPTGGGGWTNGLTVALSSTTKEPMRVTRSKTLPIGRYEFMIQRSAKPDANEKRHDRIAITAIRSVAFRKPVADETLSVLEFAVRATALNQGTLAPITCRIKPKVSTWTAGAWGPEVASSNPAALTRWLMTGPAPAVPLEREEADVRLRAWSELCVEYDWTCHLYLTDAKTQSEALAFLELAGRASMFWDGTQLAAVPWVEKPAPRQLFAGENLKDHRWQIVYPEPVHALRVEFQNLDEGGEPDEVFVYADGFGEVADPEEGIVAATLVESFRVEGQLKPERAVRDGRWELGRRLHQRRVDSWTAPVEYLVSGYGDRVRLAWSKLDGGEAAQVRTRRWSGAQVSGLRLTQPVRMVPGESYAVDLRLISGVESAVPIINPAIGEPVVTREIMFAVPRAEEDSPRAGDKVAFGVPTRISEDVEIIGIEPADGLTAALTGVRYVAPLLMAGETGPIPPLQTRLTRQRAASPPTPRLLGVQPDPVGVRVSFDMPPWSGSPVIGFSARWRPTPPEGLETGWQALAPLAAEAREGLIPSPRALPVAAGDDDGRNLVDYELRAITAAGQTSPEPMTLSAIEVREDPFIPLNLTVTPATRTAPGGSSHGVLVVAVDPLAVGVGTDIILEVRRAPVAGDPDPWESAGLPLTSSNPAGDVTGLRSGERYGFRALLRNAGGWVSDWTDEVRGTVPAGSMVSDDTKHLDGIAANLFVNRVIDVEALSAANAAAVSDLEDVYGDTASAAASAAAAALSEAETETLAAAAAGSASSAATAASGAIAAESGAASSAAAASTSATNAATSAGSASTSATSASNSATTAEGHASTAGTAATNAANSAGLASGSATAAAGSASVASTKATDASNSAAAAAASQVAAAASYGQTVILGGNLDFEQGLTGWEVSGYTPVVAPSYQGRQNVVVYGVGNQGEMYTARRFPVDTSRKYRVRSRVYVGSGTANVLVYLGLRCHDAAGNPIQSDPGFYMYAGLRSVPADSAWIELDSLNPASAGGGAPITGEGTGTYAIFPPGTRSVSILLFKYPHTGDAQVGFDGASLEDITDSQSAAQSASASSTNASSAAASASAAGSSATAAQGSATAASTSAGDALTYRNQASSSAADAQSASASAGTSASTAAAHAATASTQASSASAAAASASSSASLAVAANLSSKPNRIRNPSGANGLDGWIRTDESWATGVDVTWGSWFYRRFEGAAGLYTFLRSETITAYQGITLTLSGSAFCQGLTAGQLIIHFPMYTDADVYVGEANRYISSPFNGKFADLTFTPPPGARYGRLHVYLYNASGDPTYAHVGAWGLKLEEGSVATAFRDDATQKVLAASVAETREAVIDLEAQYAMARFQVAATTPGGAAILSLFSDNYGSVAGLAADRIYWGANTYFDDATDTLRTALGATQRVMAFGASFGTDGQLTEWEGPAAIAFSAMSRANAHFYRANVAPYAWSSDIAASTGGGGGQVEANGAIGGAYVAGGGWQTIKTFSLAGVPPNPNINLSIDAGVSTTDGGARTVEFRLIQTTGGAVVAGPDSAVVTNGGSDTGVFMNGVGTLSGTVSYQLQAQIPGGGAVTSLNGQVYFSAYQTI